MVWSAKGGVTRESMVVSGVRPGGKLSGGSASGDSWYLIQMWNKHQ